ncbi:TetR/AcrR family transcriptional regulator [Leptospira sp. GIMC2001]|uniref:TetR/AcrR family transcriptional regulator n=1 Tax=Leptospira sp. GIMC2001 TaxID=1513297 RepID=UPI00234BD8F0|nr:TetR/AcrR family transcriptional regulator [Leptospira sp. GIMC2001]WCL50050.1 TetR/AcrR family transcriptional regulator [Leptospira sp. GIMC2001]
MQVNFIINPNPLTTRDRIIQKSAELFLLKGYGGTSVDDILSAASIAKGTFYHHFISKEALLETVTENFAIAGFDELMIRLGDAKTDNPLATLNFLFRANMEWKSENVESIILAMEAMNDPANIVLRHSFISKRKKMLKPVIIKILKDGKQLGLFDFKDAGFTAEIMLNFISQLFDYLVEDIFFDRVDLADLARQNLQFAIERILGLPESSIRLVDWASYKSMKDKIKIFRANRNLSESITMQSLKIDHVVV